MVAQVDEFIQSLQPSSSQTQALNIIRTDASLTAFLRGEQYSVTKLTETACLVLTIALGNEIIDMAPIGSRNAKENWSQACWQVPACIASPLDKHDVSKILKTIRFFQIKFAIRSGGHSPNPGWSSIDSTGILIDLRHINHITVSEDRAIASLGPGGRWGKVYEVLDGYETSVMGGRIPTVGVGGVILGGGMSHFSGEYGLAADNVQDFEVVLADGSIVNANAKENADLFWALKGGGSNFGIVTNFNMYTVPARDMWYQVSIYGADQVHPIIDGFADWQLTNTDVKATIGLIIALDSTTIAFMYSKHSPPPGLFRQFDSLTPIAVAVPPTNGTLHGITQILAATSSNVPQRHDYRGASFKIDAKLYHDVHAIWKEHAATMHNATGANMTFVMQPVPVKLIQAGANNGGNPLGIPEVDQQWWTTLLDWDDAKNDDSVRAAAIATSNAWEELGKERGLYVPYIFMNDASRDQNPIKSYGEDNIRRLKSVAAKYDPDQVFQKLQNGGFLLKSV